MKRNQSIPLLVLGLILASVSSGSQAIFAEDQAESASTDMSAESPAEQKLAVKISGENALKSSVPVANGTNESASVVKATMLDSTFKLELEKGPISLVTEYSALTAPSAIKDENGNASAGLGSGLAYFSIMPLENALYYSSDKAKFGLGWQYFSWGVADEINPTDYLNARDYRYGTKDKKIPSFAGSAIWYPSDEWSLEGVIEPQFQSSKFGLNWSDAIPDELFMNGAKNVSVKNPSVRPDSFTGAFRLRYFGTDLDVSASYLYGWDRFLTPDMSLSNQGGAYAVDSITLEHRRLHRFGVDAKCVLGKFGIWAEGAYSMSEPPSESYECRKPELSWVAGFDFNFGSLDEHYVNVQYLGTFIPGYDSSFHSDYANGLPDPDSVGNLSYMRKYYYRSLVQGLGLQSERLLQGIAGTVELSFLDGKLKPTFDYLGYVPSGYDDAEVTRFGSLVLMPKLSLYPIDALRVTLGSEMAWSWIKEKGGVLKLDKTDRIGQMTDDNRAYLEIAYSWILP